MDTVMPVLRNWMGLPVTPGVGRGKATMECLLIVIYWVLFWFDASFLSIEPDVSL